MFLWTSYSAFLSLNPLFDEMGTVGIPLHGRLSGQHVSFLFVSCPTGEPRGSRGSMMGVINGQEFGMATLNISVQQEGSTEVPAIWSSISHVPASVGMWGPWDTHWTPTKEETKPRPGTCS